LLFGVEKRERGGGSGAPRLVERFGRLIMASGVGGIKRGWGRRTKRTVLDSKQRKGNEREGLWL